MAACVLELLQRPKAALGPGLQAASLPSQREQPIATQHIAHELGGSNIRVNAISAGAVQTHAASGIEHFDELLNESMRRAPLRRVVDAREVGRAALMLASDYASGITGEVLHVDAGFHVSGMIFHGPR
jgi:enoyl-[acyl-carrier protein] reductase I